MDIPDADTVEAAPPATGSVRRRSESLPRSAPARLQRPATELDVHDGARRLTTRRTRNGRTEQHTSTPPPQTPQVSSVRVTRASSVPAKRRGRPRQCGKAQCGAPGGWPVGRCTSCEGMHDRHDRLCAACHRAADTFTHTQPDTHRAAGQWLEGARKEGSSGAVLADYVPTSDCLCKRTDCFYSLFWASHKKKAYLEQKRCDVCGKAPSSKDGGQARWRPAGSASAAMMQFFTEGGGAARATYLASRQEHPLQSDSTLCSACYNAYSRSSEEGNGSATHHDCTADSDPPSGTVEGVACPTTDRVRAAVSAGSLVRVEDVEAWVLETRRAENYPDISARRLREVAIGIMENVYQGDSEVEFVTLRGDECPGFDARERHKFLVPERFGARDIAKLDLIARQATAKISDLERRLASFEQRYTAEGNPSDSGAPAGADTLSRCRREDIVEEAGRIVRQDLVCSIPLKNVSRLTTQEDDISGDLPPVREYFAELPLSLRLWFRAVFLCDMGFEVAQDPSQTTSVGGAADSSRNAAPHARKEDSTKREETTWYFIATIIIKAVLRQSYRAPHDFMLAQVLKSHGGTKRLNNFLGTLGLCLSDSQCVKRENVIVQAALENGVIPSWMDPVAAALDNCHMKAAMNLIAAQYSPFIAALCVAPRPGRRVLRLSPIEDWTPTEKVTMEEVRDGLPRDNTKPVFEDFLTALLASACRSADKFLKGEDTCVEAEFRKVRREFLFVASTAQQSNLQ